MSDLVYLNGRWLPRGEAAVGIEDRGFLFADGAYEVVRYYNGRPLAMEAHAGRMQRSLAALGIELPADMPPLAELSDQLIERNELADAVAYWQVTRGVAPRQHEPPDPPPRPTVLLMPQPAAPLQPDGPVATLCAINHEDDRWQRCEIKSIALLPNVLASRRAAAQGCDEAILVRDGRVTEGTRRTIFAVIDGELRTHPLDGSILPSITRAIAIELAGERNIPVRDRAFTTQQLHDAEEVIAVGSTTEIAAVTEVDGRPVGGGQPGPVTETLLDAYRQRVIAECGLQRA